MAACGEGDGRAEDECASEPGEGAEVLAEQLDAEVGAEQWLDVEQDAGARGGNAVDSPIPEKGGGGGAGETACGERSPCREADVEEGRWRGFVGSEGVEEPGAEDPEGEHDGSGEYGVRGDDGSRVGFKQLFADEDPDERGDEREDDEKIALERGATGAPASVMAAKDDECGSGGGGEECGPAEGLEAFTSEEDSSDAEQDGHGADHERGMADGGEVKALELDEELDGNAEEGGDKQEAGFLAREADAMQEGNGKHGKAGEEEAVEDHVLHAHFIERDAAEEEAGAPEAGGEGACSVAEECDTAA